MATPAPREVVPWVEKYRPQTLQDVAAHKDIVDTVRRLVDTNKLPHLLLYGPPGTGKTSLILAVARQIYGAQRAAQMTLHLNASDARGIDVVRHDIQGFASTRHIFNKGFKLVVLDECDAMTNDAQFALRRVIEKYTRNTRFCLICNYVNKVIPALQSRCTRFRFSPLPQDYVRERLQQIVQQEGVAVQEEPREAAQGDLDSGSPGLGGPGVAAVARLANGDMRRALNLLQSIAMRNAALSEEAVYLTTGQTRPSQVKEVVRLLLNASFKECMDRLREMQRDSGFALVDILHDLYAWVIKLQLPNPVTADLLEALANLEHNLAGGCSETLQLGALVGTFVTARHAIVDVAV